MKRCVKFLGACLSVILLAMSLTAVASNEIKVALDGEYIEFDVPPQLINNRTMVPLRAIFEELGAEVDWDGTTQTVTAIRNDVTVIAKIGSLKMYIDDEERTMDVAPVIVDGRTLVPARFVAEAFDCVVDWNGDNLEVIILTHPIEENETRFGED